MDRIERDFFKRSDRQRWNILDDMWCGSCGEGDSIIDSPIEYKEDGKIYVEGSCKRCGEQVRIEVK